MRMHGGLSSRTCTTKYKEFSSPTVGVMSSVRFAENRDCVVIMRQCS